MTDEAAIDRLRAQISAVFGETQRPDDDALLDAERMDRRSIQEGAPRVAPFHQKQWQDLNAEWLKHKRHDSGVFYFSPAAFRYFMPSFLMASLEDFTADADVLVKTVQMLCVHNYEMLRREPYDQFFESSFSAFSDAERIVVRDFLDLVFAADLGFFIRFLSAQALTNYWDVAHEATHALGRQEFFRSLRSYQRPAHPDPERESLIASVRSAFDSAPPPGASEITNETCSESREIACDFRDADWRTLHPDLLSYHNSALCFFNPGAFRYFLPAFISSALMDTNGNDDPVYSLTYVGSEAGISRSDSERMRLFNVVERRAIVDYLEFELQRDEYERPAIEAALKKYWRKTVPPA